jgi:hypothetical protein
VRVLCGRVSVRTHDLAEVVYTFRSACGSTVGEDIQQEPSRPLKTALHGCVIARGRIVISSQLVVGVNPQRPGVGAASWGKSDSVSTPSWRYRGQFKVFINRLIVVDPRYRGIAAYAAPLRVLKISGIADRIELAPIVDEALIVECSRGISVAGLPLPKPGNVRIAEPTTLNGHSIPSGTWSLGDLRRQLSSGAERNRAVHGRSICKSSLFTLGHRCSSSR